MRPTVSRMRMYGSSGSTCSSQLITADGLLLHQNKNILIYMQHQILPLLEAC